MSADSKRDGGSQAGSIKPLSLSRTLLAMGGLGLTTMMVAVDQTVVTTALPTMMAELNGFSLYAWVATAYFMTSVITIPIFGRLGDYYGRKPFLVAALLVFAVSSSLCGLAQDIWQLLAARALQGVGGGMLLGTAFACLPDLFPEPRQRLRWQIIITSAFGVANAMGPTLGGVLTYHVGWRSIFFINPPIAMMGLFFIWRYLPHIRQIQTSPARLDWMGAGLIALTLASLQLLIEMLPERGADPVTLALALLFSFAVTVLLRWEARTPHGILPMVMLRDRGLLLLFGLSLCNGLLMFTLLVYTPLLLQGGYGLTASEAGVMVTPLVVCITVGSLINGRIVTRMTRPAFMVLLGFIMMGAAIAGIVWYAEPVPGTRMTVYLVVAGVGLGFIMPNLTIFGQQLAGRSMLGIATATLQSTRMIGALLGTAVVGTIMTRRYVSGIHERLDDGPAAPSVPLLEDPQALISPDAQQAFLDRLAMHQLDGEGYLLQARDALISAVQDGFIFILLSLVLAMYLLWRLPPIQLKRIGPSAGSGPERTS